MSRCALLSAVLLALGSGSAWTAGETTPGAADGRLTWAKGFETGGSWGWERLSTFTDGAEVWLFTRRNARPSGSAVSVWRRIEFRDPQPGSTMSPRWLGTYLSVVEQVDVDCTASAERVKSANGFRGRNMTDPIEPPRVFKAEESAWQPAIPGTQRAAFVQQMCALFTLHRMQPL
jgi:hypothetical protein